MTAARILHVDDEPDIREVVQISLGMNDNLSVWSCASGEEALSTVGAWPPDLVILDVMMPNMDGPTTLARLRENPATADVPVIFMTARSQPREIEHFKSLGAVDVIPKPFDPTMLNDAIRRTLGGAGGKPIDVPAAPAPLYEVGPRHTPAPAAKAHEAAAPAVHQAAAPAADGDAASLRDADAQFAVDLCHDLRGPLTVIKMYAEILIDTLAGQLGEEEKAHFAIIVQRVVDLNAMIDKLSQRSHATLDQAAVKTRSLQ